MNDVVLDDDIKTLVPDERRELVERIVGRTSYAAPVVASYDMDTLTLSPRAVIIFSNQTDN